MGADVTGVISGFKGVADLPRRAQICRAVNDRYVAALATVPTDEPVGKLARPVCQPIVRRGRRHRALHCFAYILGLPVTC